MFPFSCRALPILGLSFSVIGVGACSSSSSGNGAKASDAGTTGDDGGPTGDGSMGTGGSGLGGAVSFFTGGGSTGGPFSVVAAFDHVTGTPTGYTPCEAPVGSCKYCGPIEGGSGLQVTFISAGALTVDDGSKTIATLDFDSQTGGDYDGTSTSTPSITWNPGDMLSVSAAGGMLPAFSGSVTAPQNIAGVNPALTLTGNATISTGSNFTLSWTPSSDDGQMKLVLASATSSFETVSCAGDESAGSFSVSSSLLRKLAMGGGTAVLTKTVSKSVTVSGAQIAIQASSPQVAGSVTFGP
jgi:hypothetical protein